MKGTHTRSPKANMKPKPSCIKSIVVRMASWGDKDTFCHYSFGLNKFCFMKCGGFISSLPDQASHYVFYLIPFRCYFWENVLGCNTFLSCAMLSVPRSRGHPPRKVAGRGSQGSWGLMVHPDLASSSQLAPSQSWSNTERSETDKIHIHYKCFPVIQNNLRRQRWRLSSNINIKDGQWVIRQLYN